MKKILLALLILIPLINFSSASVDTLYFEAKPNEIVCQNLPYDSEARFISNRYGFLEDHREDWDPQRMIFSDLQHNLTLEYPDYIDLRHLVDHRPSVCVTGQSPGKYHGYIGMSNYFGLNNLTTSTIFLSIKIKGNRWCRGADTNKDGVVNLQDLKTLKENLQQNKRYSTRLLRSLRKNFGRTDCIGKINIV